jgi:hypothetical protein
MVKVWNQETSAFFQFCLCFCFVENVYKVGWFSWNPSNSLQVATGLSRHPQTMALP